MKRERMKLTINLDADKYKIIAYRMRADGVAEQTVIYGWREEVENMVKSRYIVGRADAVTIIPPARGSAS